MAADLHCHTRISDGSATVKEVVEMASLGNLKTIAITDHDSYVGIEEAKKYAADCNIEVLSGIEFSCMDYKRGRKVHVLCYAPQKFDGIDQIIKKTYEKRHSTGMKMLDFVTERYSLPECLIERFTSGSSNIFKQQIMNALMVAGYTDSIFGGLYHELFGADGCCKMETKDEYPNVFEVIEVLKKSGGAVVLAHPSVYKSIELFDELIEYGIDGVEIYHPRNKKDDIEYLKMQAEKHRLIATGGTDFHGMYTKNPLPLGSFTVDDETVLKLKEKN